MGYYTTYHFNAINFKTMEDLDYEEMKSLCEELDKTYKLETYGDTDFSAKWYDHTEDMREFSKKYPDLLFELAGEGEDFGDIWKEYHHNGKYQILEAKIVYDDLDIDKLK